jgi:hypothetical protein
VKRRELLTAALCAPLMSGCDRSRFFVIGWDEEVRLHAGHVIVVKVRYTYEHLGSIFASNRYDPSILRSTYLSFDAGTPSGQFTQTFEKHRVNTIDQFNDKWHIVLETRGVAKFTETASGWKEEWGAPVDSAGHKCLRLDPDGLVGAPVDDLPKEYLWPNILMDTADTSELVKFDGSRVTLAQKSAYLAKYPLNPVETQIERRMHKAIPADR